MGSTKPWANNYEHSFWARSKSEGLIPGWVALVGLMSSLSLKGNLMKKDLFFHKGVGWVNSEWDSGQKLKSLVEISCNSWAMCFPGW